MNNFKENSAILQNKEEIFAFQKSELPLCIRMAGITHQDASYHIERKKERNSLFVFEYCMEGCGHLCIDGKRYLVKKGDTYILTPDTDQSYYADKSDPYKKIWVNIESSYLASLLAAHGLSYGVYHYEALSEFNEILSIAKSTQSPKLASAKIAPIVLRLIQSLSARYETEREQGLAAMIKERIDQLFTKSFSPMLLASQLHISISTMTRAFTAAYATTPYEYYLLSKERMAKELLQNTSLSAKEIAFRLGFSDEHYFSNFFKKRTGMRPIEYKESRFGQ